MRVIFEATLLVVTRELALVAADTVLARVVTGASFAEGPSFFSTASAVTRGLGSGGVLLLLSFRDLAATLAGVEEVAEIVLVRATRPGDGPGLIAPLLAVGALGFNSGADPDEATALEPATEVRVGFSALSGSALRLLSAVTDGRGRAGLSLGFNFRWTDMHTTGPPTSILLGGLSKARRSRMRSFPSSVPAYSAAPSGENTRDCRRACRGMVRNNPFSLSKSTK